MRFCILSVLAAATLATAALPLHAATVYSAFGAGVGDIQGTVDDFRAAVGANNGVGGTFAGGRREINWDAVPDGVSAPNNLPANFFNSNSPRGAVFATPGTGFQVSGRAGIAPIEFDNLNPAYSGSFTVFSPQRLFTALQSTVTDVSFFRPGTNVQSAIRAFGVVFTDVDLADTTTIEFFGFGGQSLGVFSAPTANNGLSFLGVTLDGGLQAGRVRITSGNLALGATEDVGAGLDAVAMDDFIYSEPQAIPEPSTWLLLSGGLVALGVARRRASRG